jgi:hypothetical protein
MTGVFVLLGGITLIVSIIGILDILGQRQARKAGRP